LGTSANIVPAPIAPPLCVVRKRARCVRSPKTSRLLHCGNLPRCNYRRPVVVQNDVSVFQRRGPRPPALRRAGWAGDYVERSMVAPGYSHDIAYKTSIGFHFENRPAVACVAAEQSRAEQNCQMHPYYRSPSGSAPSRSSCPASEAIESFFALSVEADNSRAGTRAHAVAAAVSSRPTTFVMHRRQGPALGVAARRRQFFACRHACSTVSCAVGFAGMTPWPQPRAPHRAVRGLLSHGRLLPRGSAEH